MKAVNRKIIVSIALFVVFCTLLIASSAFGWSPSSGEAPEVRNVAASWNGGYAKASSYGTYLGVTKYPRLINDEDLETDWCSNFEIPAAAVVEFESEYTIIWVRCVARYHTQRYQIQLSRNGSTWNTVAEHTSPNRQPSGVDEGWDDYHLTIPEQKARYMRVLVTATDAPASHIFQACLSEIQALGY